MLRAQPHGRTRDVCVCVFHLLRPWFPSWTMEEEPASGRDAFPLERSCRM